MSCVSMFLCVVSVFHQPLSLMLAVPANTTRVIQQVDYFRLTCGGLISGWQLVVYACACWIAQLTSNYSLLCDYNVSEWEDRTELRTD